ncbi:MAG: copper resistance protein B [Pseudomonadota bacterium]
MRRPYWLAIAALAIADPSAAQEHQHEAAPAAQQDPDAHAHDTGLTAAAEEIPQVPAPPPPKAFAAESYFAPADMAAARRELRREHGGTWTSNVLLRVAEYQGAGDNSGYRWDAVAWLGGDVNRIVLMSEGEGAAEAGVERGDLHALYSRAVGVYTDLQFGVRQDFKPTRRSYASAGFQTLLPYWFDVEGALFLSDAGELLVRLEGSYDARITNRWILQPRVEFTLSANDYPEIRTGSGLSIAEIGIRLRYEVERQFAPYIGISWEKQLGRTGDYVRAAGEAPQTTNFVVGIRAFF